MRENWFGELENSQIFSEKKFSHWEFDKKVRKMDIKGYKLKKKKINRAIPKKVYLVIHYPELDEEFHTRPIDQEYSTYLNLTELDYIKRLYRKNESLLEMQLNPYMEITIDHTRELEGTSVLYKILVRHNKYLKSIDTFIDSLT